MRRGFGPASSQSYPNPEIRNPKQRLIFKIRMRETVKPQALKLYEVLKIAVMGHRDLFRVLIFGFRISDFE